MDVIAICETSRNDGQNEEFFLQFSLTGKGMKDSARQNCRRLATECVNEVGSMVRRPGRWAELTRTLMAYRLCQDH